MMDDPILMYVPGLAFLFLVNIVVAVPLALFFRNKRYAVPVSVLLTAAILKAVAVIQIGYFDVSFLLILFGVGLATAVLVNKAIERLVGHEFA